MHLATTVYAYGDILICISFKKDLWILASVSITHN